MVTRLKTELFLFLPALCLSAGLTAYAVSAQGEGTSPVKPDTAVTLLVSPTDSDQLTLAVWNRSRPIHSTVQADTVIESVCSHCQIAMKFTMESIGKGCALCPCGTRNAECLSGKSAPHNRRQEMFDALPRGTALRAEFRDPKRPEEGIKRLTLDWRTVLIPLHDPAVGDEGQILAQLKPIGAVRVKLADDRRQLLITLKEDWTTDREIRMEKLFARQGPSVSFAAAMLGKP